LPCRFARTLSCRRKHRSKQRSRPCDRILPTRRESAADRYRTIEHASGSVCSCVEKDRSSLPGGFHSACSQFQAGSLCCTYRKGLTCLLLSASTWEYPKACRHRGQRRREHDFPSVPGLRRFHRTKQDQRKDLAEPRSYLTRHRVRRARVPAASPVLAQACRWQARPRCQKRQTGPGPLTDRPQGTCQRHRQANRTRFPWAQCSVRGCMPLTGAGTTALLQAVRATPADAGWRRHVYSAAGAAAWPDWSGALLVRTIVVKVDPPACSQLGTVPVHLIDSPRTTGRTRRHGKKPKRCEPA
jgi:hypothetical protein